MHWNDHEFGSIYGVIPKLTSETGFKKCAKTVALSREWWVSWQFFLCVWGGVALFLFKWDDQEFSSIYGVTPKPTLKIGPKQSRWGAVEELLVDFIVEKIQHFTNYLRTILQHWYYPPYRLPTAYITHYRTVYTLLTCRWRRTINWLVNYTVRKAIIRQRYSCKHAVKKQ